MKYIRNMQWMAFLSAFLILTQSCKKEESDIVIRPYLSTHEVQDITDNSATLYGSVTDEGDAKVTERGFTWSVNPDPEISENKIVAGNGKGDFHVTITGLNDFTTYYVRAYGINAAGISYGNYTKFTTLQKSIDVSCEETVTDIDGNVYKIVKIGSQCWMESHLKTSKYNDGTSIEHLVDAADWDKTTSGAWSFYQNHADSSEYGNLYNWFAATTSNLCPTGWRVPLEDDIMRLINHLGSGNAPALKSVTGWLEGRNGTNSTGFNFYPSGSRFVNTGFRNLGSAGYIWTSKEYSTDNGIMYGIAGSSSSLTQLNQRKNTGACVRCVRN